MADKEATIYIVDVGSSMGKKCNGRHESNLDWAMNYVWEKITILLPDLKALRRKIKLSSTDEGDAISAIVIAISMITKYCKKLKYKRKIVLVTDALGSMDADDSSEITKKIISDNMELVVIGIDFDDAEYGFKEEDKNPVKVLAFYAEPSEAHNEAALRNLVNDCDGVYGTMQQAIDEMGVPRLKSTRPVASYKGQLTLGNPVEYDSAMCIDVERYPRTMIRAPPSASQYIQRSDLISTQLSATMLSGDGDTAMTGSDPNGLTSVRNARSYQVKDDEAPGGKRDVDREELAKGYAYGSTAVPIAESEWNVTKLETQAGLEIIGFIPWSRYERYMHMSVSCVTIPQKTNNKAIMGFSSLVHALFELESYAVARLVAKAERDPLLILLAPSIESDYECLIDVQLPFAEDLRSYRFPPLDRVVTVSGKVITQHRNIPNEALNSAMSDYVDRMDLSTFGKDDEGNPAEYMEIQDTYSAVLHRIDQAVRWRAVHPNEPIPPPFDILVKYSNPPEELVKKAKRRLEKLVAAADVKKVPPKAHSRKRARAEAAPISGIDIDALLGPARKAPKTVDPENPIPSFQKLLDGAESPASIRESAESLAKIVEKHVSDSFGGNLYGRAIEELSVMRQEMIEVEEPGVYNAILRKLKEMLLKGELGGERKDFWYEIRKNRLGLVDKKGSERSDVGEDEARESSILSGDTQIFICGYYFLLVWENFLRQ
ncbi:MAG: hypothetical protein Q9195_000974 [Heterodermia aff. obscurata]